MAMPRSFNRFLTFILLGTLYALLAGCGGGGGGSSASAQGAGSVALLLTDAPAVGFDEINLHITKAELLSDSGHVTIFQGDRYYNLLDLTDARLFALRERVPAGSFSKIRLTLATLQLVSYNGTDDPADDLVVYPKLPGNGKLDLNPRGDITVAPGETLVLQLDVDANKSIHIVQKGNKQEYEFRPLVLVDIVTDAFRDRYIRLHGVVQNIDTGGSRFDLCDISLPVRIADDTLGSPGCVKVEVSDSTSIFDINGMPAAFTDLSDGGEATVFGRLRRDTHTDDSHHDIADRILVAALIELGPEGAFDKLAGQALSDVDGDDRFTLDVAPGQGLTTPVQLAVQLQSGTRVVNRKGELLDATAIQPGTAVKVRGVLDTATDTLFASLVLVDTDSFTRLTGTVGSNPDGSCGFTLQTGSGDRSIRSNSGTAVFLVSATSSGLTTEAISVSELQPGQEANVYGSAALDGCFDADTVIAFSGDSVLP